MESIGAYLGLTCHRRHHRCHMECSTRAPSGEATPPRGPVSGSGVKGVATRPLDGGALTLGQAHAPARGPAARRHACPAAMSSCIPHPRSTRHGCGVTREKRGGEEKGKRKGSRPDLLRRRFSSPVSTATMVAVAVASAVRRRAGEGRNEIRV
jgi:hypothetical protein